MKRSIYVMMFICFLVSGCSYPLSITSEPKSNGSNKSPKPVSLGFSHTEDKLINSVIDEVGRYATIKSAKKDYQFGTGVEAPDYMCELSQTTSYNASGQNFIITFPGFLIFTHSWLGYKYYIDIATQSKVLTPDGVVKTEAVFTTPYEIRFTSFARGASSSLGWFTPGYGVLNIITATIFATSYDDRATPSFIENVKPSYSMYVSKELLNQIASLQDGNVVEPAAFYRNEPVVITIGDGKESDRQNDDAYAVYLMKIEDGTATPVAYDLIHLSQKTRMSLNAVIKNGRMNDAGNLKELLSSFEMPGVRLPDGMNGISVYTMQGNRVIALFEGGSIGRYAMKQRISQ